MTDSTPTTGSKKATAKPPKRSVSCEVGEADIDLMDKLRAKLSEQSGFPVSQRQLHRRLFNEGLRVLKQQLGVQ